MSSSGANQIPASVANGFSLQAPPAQLPGSPTPASKILDPYGNVLRTFGPRTAGPPALPKFAGIIQSGLDNPTAVLFGDSLTATLTSATDGNARYPVLWAAEIAAAYPNLNITMQLWADGGQNYPGSANQQIVQSGKSGPTLTIYVFAVTGKSYEYFMNPTRLDAGCTSLNPDAIVVCLGKNEGSLTGTQSLWRLNALIARIQARNPQAEIAHLVPNPSASPAAVPNIIDELRPKVHESARLTGCDVIDGLQAFRNAGAAATTAGGTYLQADGVHPSTGPGNTGAQLLADVLAQAVRFEPGSPPRTFAPPPMITAEPSLLPNCDFQDWGSSGPSGWTLTNALATQDKTNVDDDQAWGLNIQQAAGGAPVYAYQFVSTQTLNQIKGRNVVASAMVYVPAGQGLSNARIGILDGVNTYQSQWLSTDAFGGGFLLLTVHGKIDAASAGVRLVLYGDTSSTGSCNVTWGKVWLGTGTIPRRLGRDSRLSRLATLGSTSDREHAIKQGTLAAFRESFDNRNAWASLAITSGTQVGANVPVLAGESYDHVVFRTGSTAATFGTNADGHWYVAVYDDAGNLVTQTADQGTAALASSSLKTPALQATVVPTHDCYYSVVLMVYVGTGGSPATPTIASSANFITAAMLPGQQKLGVTANAGQTTGTAPGTIGTLGTPNNLPYMALYK